MGRKIPSKKHRGVKDPLEQQARRLQNIKGKINAPPKDPDEQPIPRSLTRLFAFQDKVNKRANKKKSKSNLVQSAKDADPTSSERQNPIAHLKKLPGESGRGFSLRINSAVKALHDPLQQGYPNDVEADDVKGEQMAEQRARRQRKRRREGRVGSTEAPHQKLSRGQRLTLKKTAKKLKADEETQRQPELVYERVPFGDVTHAPPALPAPRRAPLVPGAPRPGRRELLLSAMLPTSSSGNSKKRAVPAAELLRRERARLDVVAAYRQLKKQRQVDQGNTRRKKKT